MSAIASVILACLFIMAVPVAFAALGAALLWFLVNADSYPTAVYAQRLVGGLESSPLLAVPFFLLAGGLMNHSGMSVRLLRFSSSLVGSWTGGLAQVNVLQSLLFGGITGSANADIANECKVIVPAMEARGYPRSFSVALSMTTACIAAIVPPSIGLIVYGFITNTSVGRLFMAGVIPALIMTASMMVMVGVVARRSGFEVNNRPFRRREVAEASKAGCLTLLLPVLVIGGIRVGVFSPTEAGAVAVIYAAILGVVVYKSIRLPDLPKILHEAGAQTAVVMILIASAAPFAYLLNLEQVPQNVASVLSSTFGDNQIMLLLAINVLFLVLGLAIDPAPLMFIVVPVLFPAVVAAGVDPVHFGIIVNLNLIIGAISPPEGSILFVAMAITGVRMGELTRALLPFFVLLMALQLLFTFVPALSLTLPNAMYGT